ncbi:MAG: hypothetical protein C4541_08595 [Candidatus Auribacter fodinae]|jgi:hypothetical protein|uniref:Lipoprotein LPP20-like domain-containing protein n=1 Tax=Candidatus Auribacter fodinae TaxID=2093366 RepID=A0A3A4R0Y3_9BACT|nr:MAG: hypothetical protein C4541_08595 [Candidatus Auribacter fodinae]
MRISEILTVISVIGILSGTMTPRLSAETHAQRILKVKRAAQVDAYRQLSEMIKGLQINANTYVRDFVSENDQISTHFDDFIQGAKVLGEPRFTTETDGSITAEVDVQVTLAQVMEAISRISYYRGPDQPPLETNSMKEYVVKKEFIATGTANTGAPQASSDNGSGTYGSYKDSDFANMPGWDNVTAQGRLKAERAALTDARRNLAERVEGLQITGDTYVRDFITESDTVRTNLDTFIKGIKQISPYRYHPEGIVEVDVQVTIQDVVKELTTMQQHLVQKEHFFKRDIFRTVDFEKTIDVKEKKRIQATGTGTVAESDFFTPPVQAQPVAPAPASNVPDWARQTIIATGVGVPYRGEQGPAARVNAERAAEIDARRNLVEQIYGINIDSQTTIRDYVTQDDRVSTEVTAFLSGARRIGEPVYNEDGSVEVTVEVDLEELWYLIGQERR